MSKFDDRLEALSRNLALRASRRGFLGRLGGFLFATSVATPLLPIARAQAADPRTTDPNSCEYWKYCSVDGYLCSCCGGSSTQCPPGTEPSKLSWVGSCRSVVDGKDYLVSYTDCCGTSSCGRCLCNSNIGDRPGYSMGVHNDINWCMGNGNSTIYHCTVSLMVGEA